MSTSPPNALVCRECGGHNPLGTQRCWLCGAKLPLARVTDPNVADLQDDEIVMAEAVRPAVQGFSFSLMTIFGCITLLAITFGMFKQAPGASMLIGLILVPALVITSVRSTRRMQTGKPMTTTEKVTAFLLSAVIMVGVMVMLVVAAFVALFVWCMFFFSGFH